MRANANCALAALLFLAACAAPYTAPQEPAAVAEKAAPAPAVETLGASDPVALEAPAPVADAAVYVDAAPSNTIRPLEMCTGDGIGGTGCPDR